MSIKKILIGYSLKHPKPIIGLSFLITLLFLVAMPNIRTDTDPVKMLTPDNPAVVLYNQMKAEFRLSDMIVVGIQDLSGASLFTVDRLRRIHKITQDIQAISIPPSPTTFWTSLFKFIQWSKPDILLNKTFKKLIINADILSPSTVDDIILNQKGELNIAPLMRKPPQTETEAQNLLKKINKNAIFNGKLASVDGSLIGIFLPLVKGKKNLSYSIGLKIQKIMDQNLRPGEQYYLAGLPIAETTFGIEMFFQMGIYAPIAGVLIFFLLFLFFGDWRLASGSMILAAMTVIWAMGGLIYSGNPVHIMSSMIPIFLMPIALLDSIHIISHLKDRNKPIKRPLIAIWQVMSGLFNPMLFTSLTTLVGFISLSTTGIQPIKVFGITIGLGVMLAWLLSMTFLPAYLLLIDPSIKKPLTIDKKDSYYSINRLINFFRIFAIRFPKQLVIASILLMIFSLFGIRMITINDNPVRWFKSDHKLRKSDRVMNNKLAGTYMANLIFELQPVSKKKSSPQQSQNAITKPIDFETNVFETENLPLLTPDLKDGGLIRYIDKIQSFLLTVQDEKGNKIVGATTSIADFLKKVGQTAFQNPEIPMSRKTIAQYLFLYESGDHDKGRDLWKFITMDYQKAQIWLQRKNGDNQIMNHLISELDHYIKKPENRSPILKLPTGDLKLAIKWSGLTHINNVWQNEMVKGMGYALIGSFLAVFFMMNILFRSTIWAIISMIPLALSMLFIYGFIGWTGKYYDMPIAVLSCLALGLSIDFAIHFNQTFREFFKQTKSFHKTLERVFKEPCSAISRNILVISIGFTPLFFAELVPYITVGVFFSAIILISGIASLLLLPALIYLLQPWLPEMREKSKFIR